MTRERPHIIKADAYFYERNAAALKFASRTP
jgi:hypothetical protein